MLVIRAGHRYSISPPLSTQWDGYLPAALEVQCDMPLAVANEMSAETTGIASSRSFKNPCVIHLLPFPASAEAEVEVQLLSAWVPE